MTLPTLKTSLLAPSYTFPPLLQRSSGTDCSDDDTDSSELLSQIRENLNPAHGNWCRVSWELLESENAFELLTKWTSPRACIIDILSTYGPSFIRSEQNVSSAEAFDREYHQLENPPQNPLAHTAIAMDNIGLALEIHVIDIPFNANLLPSINQDNKLSAHPKCIFGNQGTTPLPRLYLLREKDTSGIPLYTAVLSGKISSVNLLENNLFEVFKPQNAEQ